jgi:hypothetical protein
MITKDTFAFLYATRFWVMFIGALAYYLQTKGWIGQPEMLFIVTISGGFTIVRTIDRATEQPILAAAVTAGQVDAKTLIKIPPTASDTMTTTLNTTANVTGTTAVVGEV